MGFRKNLQISLVTVASIWLVYFINQTLVIDLRLFGLIPRHINGLRGILFGPFLHADLQHLTANTGALFVLLTVSLSYSRKLTLKASLVIMLLGGVMVWLFGRGGTIHIGASGVIFGLIGYLMCLGVFRRDWKALIISIAITIVYGGAVHSLLMPIPGISWTGHLFGFMSGVLAAWWTRIERRKK